MFGILVCVEFGFLVDVIIFGGGVFVIIFMCDFFDFIGIGFLKDSFWVVLFGLYLNVVVGMVEVVICFNDCFLFFFGEGVIYFMDILGVVLLDFLNFIWIVVCLFMLVNRDFNVFGILLRLIDVVGLIELILLVVVVVIMVVVVVVVVVVVGVVLDVVVEVVGVVVFVEVIVGVVVIIVVLIVVDFVFEVVFGDVVVIFVVVGLVVVVVIVVVVDVVSIVVVFFIIVVSFCVVEVVVEVFWEGVIGVDDEFFIGSFVVGVIVLVFMDIFVVGVVVLFFMKLLVLIVFDVFVFVLFLINFFCFKINCKNCMKFCVEVFGGMVVLMIILLIVGWILMFDFVLVLGVLVVFIGLIVVFLIIFVVGGIGVFICVGWFFWVLFKENCVFVSLLLNCFKLFWFCNVLKLMMFCILVWFLLLLNVNCDFCDRFLFGFGMIENLLVLFLLLCWLVFFVLF